MTQIVLFAIAFAYGCVLRVIYFLQAVLAKKTALLPRNDHTRLFLVRARGNGLFSDRAVFGGRRILLLYALRNARGIFSRSYMVVN